MSEEIATIDIDDLNKSKEDILKILQPGNRINHTQSNTGTPNKLIINYDDADRWD